MPAPPADPAPRFSIVVPVFNEVTWLPQALPALYAELERLGPSFEVILVENGSSDGTAAVADALRSRFRALEVLHLPRPDYGAAVRAGFRHGRGTWRVIFDSDYFSGAFLEQVAASEGRADVVLASKRAPGSEDERSGWRRLGSGVFSVLLRRLFGTRISDTHGMKAVRAELVAAIEPQVVSNRELFDTELVLRAERAGWRIAEVPVRVEERRPSRTSLLRRVPRTLLGLVRLRRALNASGQNWPERVRAKS